MNTMIKRWVPALVLAGLAFATTACSMANSIARSSGG